MTRIEKAVFVRQGTGSSALRELRWKSPSPGLSLRQAFLLATHHIWRWGLRNFLTGFRSPVSLSSPRCCPELAALLQVLTLWSCYQIDVLGSRPMRLAALLSLALLSSGAVYAHDSHKARSSDESQDVATAKAMRRVPEGATVTDTSCKKLN